jgi:flagellar assembly protein FliH
MTKTAPQKFVFDTEFSETGEGFVPAPRQKQLFTREDVEKIQDEFFAKGQKSALVAAQDRVVAAQEALAHAEQSRLAEDQLRVGAEQDRLKAEHYTQEAVETLIQHTQSVFYDMGQVSHAHWKQAAELALVAAKQIAGEAFKHCPQGAILAAMDALANEIKAQPRLTVRAGASWADRFQAALDQKARALGLPCQVRVVADPDLPLGAFDFDWGDGRARFDPDLAAEKIGLALRAALNSGPAIAPEPNLVPSQNGT